VLLDATTDAEDKAASTAGLTALRKALLPENAMSARFTTTAGPDLKQISGTVYVGTHEGTSGEQRILWVKLLDRMYPTGPWLIGNTLGRADDAQYTRSGTIRGYCLSSTRPCMSSRSCKAAPTS
jgi:hypothetical protein